MGEIKELLIHLGINNPDEFALAWISQNAAQFEAAHASLKSQDFNAYMALQVQAIISAAKKLAANNN